jgi:hypothetical protein
MEVLLSISIHFLLIFCVSLFCAAVGYLYSGLWRGSEDEHLFLLPAGMLIVLATGFLVFKSGTNNPGIIIGALLLVGGVASRILAQRTSRHPAPLRTKEDRASLLRLVLITSAALSLMTGSVNILQLIGSNGIAAVSTSFDTSSGDMFSYLLLSDGLRTVGWGGEFPHLELLPSGAGPSTLSEIMEHGGAGGYVLLATFASILGLPTWAIGSAVLALAWQSLILTSTYVLARFSALPRRLVSILPTLTLSSFAFVVAIGWWALNQIIFMSLIIMMAVCLIHASKMREIQERSKWFFASGVIGAVAFETYPSVAMYSMVPVLAVSAIWFGVKLTSETKRIDWTPLWVVPPFAYSLLGTLQFLPVLFSWQFSHDLTLSVRAPGLFDFLGLIPSGLIVERFPFFEPIIAVLYNSVFWGALIFLAFAYLIYRTPEEVGSRFPLLLLGLGGSVLLVYSGIISPMTYQAHKLALTWYPVTLLALTALWGGRERLAPKMLRASSVLVNFIPTMIGLNLAASMVYFSSTISIPERKIEIRTDSTTWNAHSITLDAVSLGDALSSLPIHAVLTDFSNGSGWVPLDRTVLPGLFRPTGPLVLSGGSTAGYPYYTGWSIVKAADLDTTDDIIYENGSFAIRHTCRLVCSDPESGLTAMVLGFDAKENESSEFRNETFFEAPVEDPLSVRLIGAPDREVRVSVVWGGVQGSFSTYECQHSSNLFEYDIMGTLNKDGEQILSLAPPTIQGCLVDLKKVTVG